MTRKMTKDIFTYTVKCRTCRTAFEVQLFESHEKNLFLVDRKDWYCEKCKADYFKKQTAALTEAHQAIGFPELEGTGKQVSWAEKIRGELINKVDYLRKSLTFDTVEDETLSHKAFEIFFREWHEEKDAKWWIDQRRMNIRDISKRIEEITSDMQKE